MVPELSSSGALGLFVLMADQQQIPTPDELTTPFIDALVSLRPKALGPINSGDSRYGDVVAGLKAETRVVRARLVDEAIAARLPLASGRALLELVRSEYWVDADVGPKTAVGAQIITRTKTNTTGSNSTTFARGVIPQGFRFRKLGNPAASPPVADATYLAATSVVVNDIDVVTDNHDGTFTHVQTVSIPLTCDRPGAHGNTPYFLANGLLGFFPYSFTLVDKPFDPLFTSSLGDAAGGSDGLSDAALRMLAQANFTGQFAPTDGALFAGALSSAGVEHAAIVEDATTATSLVFATDASWGGSERFRTSVEQALKDNWQGFGCQVRVRRVMNQRISVKATIPLVDPKFLSETTDVANVIAAALRRYFDERPDWYTWKTRAIAATIAGSDRRVLTVDPATVFVVDQDGNALGEPPSALSASQPTATHYYLTDNAVDFSFTGP